MTTNMTHENHGQDSHDYTKQFLKNDPIVAMSIDLQLRPVSEAQYAKKEASTNDVHESGEICLLWHLCQDPEA